MVRAGYLIGAIALTLLSSASAFAEAPMDWYIDLKREAKYARIASQRGASVQDLRPFDDAATRLIARIDRWDAGKAPRGSSGPCLVAAQSFQAALKRYSAEARAAAIAEGEPKQEACLSAIQGR